MYRKKLCKTPWGWLALAVLLLGTGCGPIQSSTSILRAKDALRAAHRQQGWKYACYEYYAAKRYLLRARIESGYSDFQAATDNAVRATKYAKRARAIAQLHKVRGSQAMRNGTIPFILERKGQVRVICAKPPVMKKRYRFTSKSKPKLKSTPKRVVRVSKAKPKKSKK